MPSSRRVRAARSCLGLTAEVDGVKSDYTITFSSGKINAARGRAYASAKAPGGRETDAERLAAVIGALTGVKPKAHRMKNGNNDKVRQSASRRFHALRRAGEHHSEMARREGPVNKPT